MFRRWKWFRRRRRSSSAQRAAAAAALRDDRLVREALDDYVRLTFRQPGAGAESPAGARCSLRRLPLDSAPRGHGRWNLDEQLLGAGRRRSYTVLYLGASPADSRSSKTSQAGAGTSGFSCDCSEQSRCPHAGGQATTGDQPRRAVETADASTQAPIPKKPFRPWKQQKKKEEPDTKEEPTSNDKAVQVERSEFTLPKSSQTDSPRKLDEVDEDAEEPSARSQSATPRKRSKVEQDAPEPNGQEVRSQSATPRKRSKEREDTEEPTPEAARSKTATPRKRSKEGEGNEEPNGQVFRSQSATPRKRSKEREDTEEPTRQVVRSQSATPRKGGQVEEEPTGASPARSRPRQVEAVTQTDDLPSQKAVVRLLPGPSGLLTIVIESMASPQYAYPNGQSSTSNVGVQVCDEQPVAAAGESSRSGRPGERRSKAAVAGRGRPSRTRVDGPRGGRGGEQLAQRATGPLQEAPAPAPHADDPGSLRWAQWDDKQSPWAASQKYSILDTTEESNDSVLRASSSSQNIDKRIAEESKPPSAAAGAAGVVLTRPPPPAPGSREPAGAAPATCPLTGCPGDRRRRPCGTATPTPPPTPPPTRPETPPGLHHPNVRRHDCVSQPPNGGGQSPR